MNWIEKILKTFFAVWVIFMAFSGAALLTLMAFELWRTALNA